jgi:hypothetical protein
MPSAHACQDTLSSLPDAGLSLSLLLDLFSARRHVWALPGLECWYAQVLQLQQHPPPVQPLELLPLSPPCL